MKIQPNFQRIFRGTWILALSLIFLTLSSCSMPPTPGISLPSTAAKISATNGKPKISLSLLQPEQYLEPDGKLCYTNSKFKIQNSK